MLRETSKECENTSKSKGDNEANTIERTIEYIEVNVEPYIVKTKVEALHDNDALMLASKIDTLLIKLGYETNIIIQWRKEK